MIVNTHNDGYEYKKFSESRQVLEIAKTASWILPKYELDGKIYFSRMQTCAVNQFEYKGERGINFCGWTPDEWDIDLSRDEAGRIVCLFEKAISLLEQYRKKTGLFERVKSFLVKDKRSLYYNIVGRIDIPLWGNDPSNSIIDGYLEVGVFKEFIVMTANGNIPAKGFTNMEIDSRGDGIVLMNIAETIILIDKIKEGFENS